MPLIDLEIELRYDIYKDKTVNEATEKQINIKPNRTLVVKRSGYVI